MTAMRMKNLNYQKLPNYLHLLNIRKGLSKKGYPQKRSEVSLKNVRRFRLYKNTCLIFCKNVVHLSVFLVAKYIRLTCNLRLYSNMHGCRDKVK